MFESGYYLKYFIFLIFGKIKRLVIMCLIWRILWLKKIGYLVWVIIKNVIEVFFDFRLDV